MSFTTKDQGTVAVFGEVVALTPKAVLFCIDTINDDDTSAGEELWIPLSQVTDPDVLERGKEAEIEVKAWIMEKNGLWENPEEAP